MSTPHYAQIHLMLLELGIPAHYSGYRRLMDCIPRYAEDPEQSITKEIYPDVAKQYGIKPSVVETTIRRAIHAGWENGDREVWEFYFPNYTKAPSNMAFIATLAERLK